MSRPLPYQLRTQLQYAHLYLGIRVDRFDRVVAAVQQLGQVAKAAGPTGFALGP